MKLDIYPTRELAEQKKQLGLQEKPGVLGNFPVTFENFVTHCIRDKRGSGALIGDFKKGIILSQIYDKLLRSGKFAYFDSYRQGFVRQLGEVIGELKRQALDSEEFKRISPATAAMQDIAAIYQAYQEYLDLRGFYDKEDRYRICLEHIPKSKYVSQFDAFSFREFHHMPRIQKKILEALGERAKVEDSPLKTSMEKITVVEAKDRRTEVYLLAEKVLEDLAAGLLPERMCIAVRSPHLYHQSLCQVFREAGIPLRWRERHLLIQNPFVRALISALEGKPGVYFEKPLSESTVLLQSLGLWSNKVLKTLYSLGFPASFFEIHRGDLRLIQRDIKAFETLENLLKEVVDTLSPQQEAIDVGTFAHILRGFAKEHSYSYGSQSQGIAVLTPSTLRGLSFDKVYALGMVEGEYPRDFRPDWLLREEDRHYINQQGYNLDTIDILLKRERESFGFLTSCSDVGYFSYPLTEKDGSPLIMSSYLEELMEKAKEVSLTRGDFAMAYRTKAISQKKAWNSGDRAISAIPEAGRHCLQKPFSASAINSYGQCPFKFFLERVLNLAQDIEEEEYSKMARGNVMHQVLQEFYARRLGESLRKEDMDQYAEEIAALVEDYLGAEYRENFEHPRLYEMERDELIETIVKYIEYHIKTQGDYTPWKLEYPFGFDKPFSLKDLPDVRFRGIIDRIDISPEKDLVIFDYKNSWTPPLEELYEGINLQLPLYILAIEELLGKPVKGGAYISLKKANADSILVRDKALPFAKRKRKGVFTEEEWGKLRGQVIESLKSMVDKISRGKFAPEPKKCPKIDEYGAFCDFAEVCPWEVEEA